MIFSGLRQIAGLNLKWNKQVEIILNFYKIRQSTDLPGKI